MPLKIPLAERWIALLREWRDEVRAQRAWRRALAMEAFDDWESLESRRHFSIFPLEEVLACREDLALQTGQDPEAARGRFVRRSRACFGCGRDPVELEWIFFQSPLWTWLQRCGRAGWVVYCTACDNQVSFHRTRMS